ncbi:hypothetical protein Ana3638_13065 [Anaerocolumna sedimenticola]|uniref:Uncharacterized protein n=1 Tax=Anaerocolumna sedimenticola TaxID=2696063 RepID=A0A6P1TQ96_9FIRM|nr:hypothetical protein [Anaerocolumna sedimenticola]QHQ61588.1 hypothetical protein Ana3638_13065 [Anaerocolumna sedimenticola]
MILIFITLTPLEEEFTAYKNNIPICRKCQINLNTETGDEVVRDERMLKLYYIKCIDTEAANKILDEFEERCKRKLKTRKLILKILNQRLPQIQKNFIPPALEHIF